MTNNSKGRPRRLDMNGIAFAMLWIFIFCIPWEQELVVPVEIAFSHFVGAAAAVAGVVACLQNRRIRRLTGIHYLAAALVVWSILSSFWSIAPDLTRVRITSSVQLFFMIWLIWEFARTSDRQMSLVAAYVIGAWVATISTLYSFAAGIGDNVDRAEGRYTLAGSNENEQGIILALGVAAACYLLASNKAPRMFWFLSVPVLVIAVLFTGSRGSLISTAIALLMFPFSLRSFSRTSKIAGVIALAAASVLAMAVLPAATLERARSIPDELTGGTLTKRTYIWSAGLEAYREHPILGVGAGAFEASVYKQLDIAYVAHNSYLSVLVELGAVGMILFAALLAALLQSALSLPGVPRMAWVILLLTWGVAVLSVTWEHRKPTWFVFGLLMAQSAALTRRKVRAPELITSPCVSFQQRWEARK